MDGSAGDYATSALPQVPYGGGREPLPPTWDGLEPSSTFPVFEKNVKLWEFETELEEKKRGVRLLRCLSGVARAAADSLDFDDLTTSKGVQNIMECLKEQFAPHLEQSLPRAFEKAIYGAPRSHKETMQEYIIRMERSFHSLEKEGVTLPTMALGYVMYRQASLSENQDLRYGAWAQGKYDKKTVISCLRKLDKVAEAKSKSAATYLQEEEASTPDLAEFFDEDSQDFAADGDENHIYIEEGDMDRIYSEEEVQMALATYQEVRKAIQMNQKGRKFYKGAQSGKGRGSQQGNEYYKNKQRVHIEQLKLRTRCARCGTIGHWARECRLPPDEKGKQHVSSMSSTTSKGAPSASSSGGGKSWFVASEAGSGTLLGSSEEFLCFQCRGHCTDSLLEVCTQNKREDCLCQDEIPHGFLLRGSRFGERGLKLCPPVDGSGVEVGTNFSLFVGLTTNPASAIVDTAAQDGLIGKAALERLKRQLAEHGLQVVMTNKQARAHGVGGPARVIGIVAIPLGIAGSSGVLEATVVDNDVPLLLPIKLLRSLHAVIDVGRSCITFQELGETLDLHNLPSGHVAMDVLSFGEKGFCLPKDALAAGFNESDFRLPVGSECAIAMQHHVIPTTCYSSGHVFGIKSSGISACLQSWSASSSGCRDEEGAQRQGGRASLEVFARQGLQPAGFGFARGLGRYLAASAASGTNYGGVSFGTILRAAQRAHRHRRALGEDEVQVRGKLLECGVQSPGDAVDAGRKSIQCVGDMQELSLQVEGTLLDAAEEESEELPKAISGDEAGEGREVQCSEARGATGNGERVQCGVHPKDECREGEGETGRGRSAKEVVGGPTGDQRAEIGAKGCIEDGNVEQHDDDRMGNNAHGQEVPGALGLLRWRDVCHGGGEVEAERGEVCHGRTGEDASNVCREPGMDAGRLGPVKCFQDSGEKAIEVAGKDSSTVFVKLRGGDLVEGALEESAYFQVSEIYVEEEGVLHEVHREDVEEDDACVVGIQKSKRAIFEELLGDEEEIALSKKQKKQLRRAEAEVRRQNEAYKVSISEVYSPPRVTAEAQRSGMKVGGAYDLQTGYDLKSTNDQARMWSELEEDDPELTVLSPPCTPFSQLQELNFPKMDFAKVVALVGEGLLHWDVACQVAWWQCMRGKTFLLEHPLGSKAWREDSVNELKQRPDVYECIVDMCAYGMQVGNLPNKKPTRFLTNSKYLAQELQERCGGGHLHETLMGGLAAKAARYPQGLCSAIVRGLKKQIRATQRRRSEETMKKASDYEITEVFMGRRPRDGLEDFEDLFPEDIEEYRGERREEQRQRRNEERRLEAAVTEEDKKVAKLHVNLGHPARDSFLRFLRAGRVREEVVRWTAKEFKCAACESHAVPKAPRPSVVPKSYAPGVAVAMDLFYIPDVQNQRSIPVLNLVDMGTNYQMIEMLESREPASVWRAFWAVWARTFGMPQYVAIDEGLEFRGSFSQWCSHFGTIVFRSAARSPWQQGKVERHGGVIKEMIAKAREAAVPTSDEELKAVLYECECAKNRFANRSGFSPVQRQIGQWPRLPGSLMSDESLDPSLQAIQGGDDFERQMQLRKIAQEAFVKLASREAAAKALKARPRIQRTFKAGEAVYVFRVLRKKKSVQGHDAGERGYGVGQKASWIGPGFVLAMEGSIVWLNMYGELWRAAVEQVRSATTEEQMGIEVITEEFSEMQERLKRGSHRAGYRDVTGELSKIQQELEDEVEKEGRDRGRPRIRFEEGAEAIGRREEAEEDHDRGSDYTPSIRPSDGGEEGGRFERRASAQTEMEPEAEIVEPNIADEAEEFRAERSREDQEATEAASRVMTDSVVEAETLDGGRPSYDAIRERVEARWERRRETPYHAEFFFAGEGEEVQEENVEPKHDYWVFDVHRQTLQRHHVSWRRSLFNPSSSEQSPVPLRALRSKRRTTLVMGRGETQEVVDQWSLFSKREERFDWWKGITEFEVDGYYLKGHAEGPGAGKKKRGEGEVFEHEIPKEEWPEWVNQDREEFDKIVKSGGLRILSLEESRVVKENLRKEGRLNRILPSRMVRRYKPAEAPGLPRTKKSRFCIRGDRDPDAAQLSRFAPTVTTSNLQVMIQAAVNKGYKGVVGDLKSAFTQSLPLCREEGPLYCKSSGGSMPDLHPEQIAEIKLGCYGLCDAPLHWRRTLVSYLTKELGYRQSNLDPCTFLLQSGEGLHGVVAVEIDDLLMFGDRRHEEKMKKLQSHFVFGKIEPVNEKGVNFNGRRLRCVGGDILIDMKAFVEERLEEVPLEKERMKMKKERLNEAEIAEVRRACGSLNWAGREGRPDAAATASMFSSQMMEMRIEDVLEMNKAISRIKQQSELALRVQRIPEEKMRWGVISDASFGNARGGKTQGGHMLITFHEEMLEGKEARCNLLHWKSGKLQRTVNSTLAAETQALARGVGDLLWMMVMYLEMVDPQFQLREWRKAVNRFGYTAFTKYDDKEELAGALAIVDAKSLYDLLAHETTGGADRRTALDVQVLREELSELSGCIRWIDHMHMPADCLTKKSGRADSLMRLLESGRFGVTEEAITLSSRLQDRQEKGYNRR